ncbi:FK506 binding protein [Aureococcus anophagefferens]|nr:FK506 binding protein [Aureococcus anophagefferens]
MKLINLVATLLASATGFAPTPRRVARLPQLRATTASGIEYEDVTVGEGRTPNTGDFVSVVYETRVGGRCIDPKIDKADLQYTADGELVTSFKNRGKPWAEFQVGKGLVIAGWDEMVQTMRPGGTRTVKLPAELAYGDAGSPDGVIKPGTDVEFTIELVGIASNADIIGGTARRRPRRRRHRRQRVPSPSRATSREYLRARSAAR